MNYPSIALYSQYEGMIFASQFSTKIILFCSVSVVKRVAKDSVVKKIVKEITNAMKSAL